jgi:hypothetical protein
MMQRSSVLRSWGQPITTTTFDQSLGTQATHRSGLTDVEDQHTAIVTSFRQFTDFLWSLISRADTYREYGRLETRALHLILDD